MSRTSLLVLAALVFGCAKEETPAPAPTIEPGVGLSVSGGPLRLGQAWSEVTGRLGTPPVLRDLGAIGTRFEFPDFKVSGMVVAGAVSRLTVYQGFPGVTAQDIGPGAERSAVTAAYGEGVTDTFIKASFYREQGLVFEWADDKVVRIHVVAAKP